MSLFAPLFLRRAEAICSLALLTGAVSPAMALENSQLKFSGAGWIQYGMIVKSLDTVEAKEMDGRAMLGNGAQFGLTYQASENLEIGAGLGVGAGHFIAARPNNGFYAPMGIGPFVSAAHAKYSFWNGEDSKLFVQVGLFPYDYAPDAQNLGLYLLRGPVYPGLLTSGFETKYVLPVANTFGFQLHHQAGSFEHDLLLTFETDYYPFWDMTPSYIATFHAGSAFRIGAGVSLYHALPIDGELTSDTTSYVTYVDPVTKEATPISFKGTKLMANFSFDPKALFGGSGAMGEADLKLYGEVGVLGLDNDAAHKALYGDITKRMPMMVGFNLPAFKILDRLALEVEYYGAPWVDDPSIYNHTSGNFERPIPKISGADTNTTKDNLRWSLYGSKVLQGHVKLSFQAASDNSRPGLFNGYGDNNPPASNIPFFSPSEWYWMTKIAYFF